jgi:hypothetical protein
MELLRTIAAANITLSAVQILMIAGFGLMVMITTYILGCSHTHEEYTKREENKFNELTNNKHVL